MFTHSSCGGGLEEILVLISFCVIHYCESGDCSFPSWNGPSPPPPELRSREGEARLGPELLAQPSQALPCCSEGFPGIHRGWWCGCFSEEPTPGIGTLAFRLLPFPVSKHYLAKEACFPVWPVVRGAERLCDSI